MFGFFTALTKAHGKKALSQVNDAIVAYDPATASAAQLEMMEADLDKVGKDAEVVEHEMRTELVLHSLKAELVALALGTFDLGIAYRYGLGVPRMFSEALDLFGRSSAQGNPDAGYELALMYQDGAGVRSSAEKALELMREAAKEGSRQAIAWLDTHDLSTKKQRRIPRPLMVVIVLVVLLIILTLV